MIRYSRSVMGLSLVLLLGGHGTARAQLELPPELSRVLERALTLLPPEVEAKLDLDAGQKKQLAKVQSEFELRSALAFGKAPAQLDKLRETLDKVRQNGDLEAVVKTLDELRGLGEDFAKLRADSQAKVRGLLTAEQQQKYDALMKGAGLLGVRPTDLISDQRLGSLLGQLGAGGPLVPPRLEERLRLTAEQKRQLDALQKEYEEKGKAARAQMEANAGKLRAGVEKVLEGQDPAAALQALQGAGGPMLQARQLRRDYEGKVRDLLTAEQRRQYDEPPRDRLRRLRQSR